MKKVIIAIALIFSTVISSSAATVSFGDKKDVGSGDFRGDKKDVGSGDVKGDKKDVGSGDVKGDKKDVGSGD